MRHGHRGDTEGDEVNLLPCWSCGAENEPCDEEMCFCAKCVDPDGYWEWRTGNPEAYDHWLERNEAW